MLQGAGMWPGAVLLVAMSATCEECALLLEGRPREVVGRGGRSSLRFKSAGRGSRPECWDERVWVQG